MAETKKAEEKLSTDLPEIEKLSYFIHDPPKLSPELIKCILRKGHKMLISGPSKAGKTFLLIMLAICIAGGISWLGFKCEKGRVLYINLEIDKPSLISRFKKVYEHLKISEDTTENIDLWNLRGRTYALDKLVPEIIKRAEDQHYDAIIIDPIYKVITGDENSASDMAYFCNQFDKLTALGCAVIYVHHHSKGVQGNKKSMDRASGSGVFSRDADALLDLIQLEMSDDIINNECDKGATAWRLESTLREFPDIKPVDLWFKYPIHEVDTRGVLSEMAAQGTKKAGQIKNKKSKSTKDAEAEFLNAYNAQNLQGVGVSVKEMADYMECTDKTIYARIKKMPDFVLKDGKIFHLKPTES